MKILYKHIIIKSIPIFAAILAGISFAQFRIWFLPKDEKEAKLSLMGGTAETLPDGSIGFLLRSPLTLNGVNELYIDTNKDNHFESSILEAYVGRWDGFWCRNEDDNNDLIPDECSVWLGHKDCLITLQRESSRDLTWQKVSFMMPSRDRNSQVFIYHDIDYDGIVDTRVKTNTQREPQLKWVFKDDRWIEVIRTIDQYTVEAESDDHTSSRCLFFVEGKWQERNDIHADMSTMKDLQSQAEKELRNPK